MGIRWKRRLWPGDLLIAAALIAFGLALGLSRYRVGIDLGDEGFLAFGAVRTLAGQLPHRDFVSLQPPLSFYTVAATFAVLGTSLASLRLLGLFIYLAIPVLVYAVARQLGGRPMSLAAAVPALVVGMPFFNFVPYAVWHGVLFTLMTTLFILRATGGGGRVWCGLAGVTTACTLLSRHDQGAYLIASILAYALALHRAKWRGREIRPGGVLATWGLATVVPLLFAGIYWLASGALPGMYRQLVLFPLTRYAKTSSLPMPAWHAGLPAAQVVLTALFYLAPVVGLLVAVWLMRRVLGGRFAVEHARGVLLLVLSILFYCQVLTRSDLFHLIITFGPLFVLLAWSADAGCAFLVRAIGRLGPGETAGPATGRVAAGRTPVRFVAIAVYALPVALVAWFLIGFSSTFLHTPEPSLRRLDLPRGGVSVDPVTESSLRGLVVELQKRTPPDRSMLALPYSPMFYFLCERRNPTRWNYLWPGDQTAEDHGAFIEQARKDPPSVVVIESEDAMAKYARPIVDYVRSNFRLAHESGVVRVYLPAVSSGR